MLESVIQREAFLFVSSTHDGFSLYTRSCWEIWVELNQEVKGRVAETCPGHEAERPRSDHSGPEEQDEKDKETMRQMRHESNSFWSRYYTTHHLNQHLQEGHELQQLVVVLVHEPALNGNPVGQLETKCHSSASCFQLVTSCS